MHPTPKTPLKTRLSPQLLAVAASAALAFAAPAVADPAACAAVDAANVKQSHTPFHSTTTDNGKQSQSVMTGGMRYLQIGGKWLKHPAGSSDFRLAKDTPTVSCAVAGHDVAGGEPTAVYTVHNAADGATSDAKVWISMARGLPLRTSTVVSYGGVKHQIEVTYDYANVRAPI